jgi:hypothetical protein
LLFYPYALDRTDNGKHTPGIRGLSPVRKEEICSTCGAQARVKYLFRGHASVTDLGSIYASEIQMGLAFMRTLNALRPLRKALRHIFAHVVTATADRGADSSIDVPAFASIVGQELVNGFGSYLGGGTPPTGMHCCYGACAAMRKKDGHAVGGSHREYLSNLSDHQTIAFLLAILEELGVPNFVRVNLPKAHLKFWGEVAGAERML